MEGKGAILITGASRGLGRELAVAYAKQGHRVYGVARKAEGVLELQQYAKNEGLSIVAFRADISAQMDLDKIAQHIQSDKQSLKLVVHNASMLGPRVSLEEYDLNVYQQVMKTNAWGPLALTQKLLPLMQEGAVIQFVTSGVGVVGKARWGAYSISKFALEGQAQIWAEELKGRAITVQIVDPGGMRTGMRAEAFPEEDPSKLLKPKDNVPAFVYLAQEVGLESSGSRFKAQSLSF